MAPRLGRGLSFNGTSQSVSTGITNLNYATGSVVWWQRPSTAHNSSAVRGIWGQVSGAGEFSAQIFTDNNWYIGWRQGGTDRRLTFAASAAHWTVGVITGFVFTYSPAGSKLYANGALIASTAAAPNPFDVGADFRFGQQNIAPATWFPGDMWAPRILARELLPGDVARLVRDPWAGTARTRRTVVYAPSTATTLTPGPGAVTYTGQAVTVRAGATLAVGAGAATYAGQQASVAAGASVAVGAGAVAYQGQLATVSEPITVAVGPGAVEYVGQGVRVVIGDDSPALGGDDAPARREDIDRLTRRRQRQEAERATRAARLRATLERAYRAAAGEAVEEAEATLAEAAEMAPTTMRERIADVAPMLGTAQALAELRAILASMQDRRDRLAREDDELAFILAVL
jgi:hypothetical protein